MSNNITPYTIYLKVYTSLTEGCDVKVSNFVHVEESFLGGYTTTPYNETQAIAATIALQDFKSNLPQKKKSELISAITELLD